MVSSLAASAARSGHAAPVPAAAARGRTVVGASRIVAQGGGTGDANGCPTAANYTLIMAFLPLTLPKPFWGRDHASTLAPPLANAEIRAEKTRTSLWLAVSSPETLSAVYMLPFQRCLVRVRRVSGHRTYLRTHTGEKQAFRVHM